jgi:hypothetical protein
MRPARQAITQFHGHAVLADQPAPALGLGLEKSLLLGGGHGHHPPAGLHDARAEVGIGHYL